MSDIYTRRRASLANIDGNGMAHLPPRQAPSGPASGPAVNSSARPAAGALVPKKLDPAAIYAKRRAAVMAEVAGRPFR